MKLSFLLETDSNISFKQAYNRMLELNFTYKDTFFKFVFKESGITLEWEYTKESYEIWTFHNRPNPIIVKDSLLLNLPPGYFHEITNDFSSKFNHIKYCIYYLLAIADIKHAIPTITLANNGQLTQHGYPKRGVEHISESDAFNLAQYLKEKEYYGTYRVGENKNVFSKGSIYICIDTIASDSDLVLQISSRGD